MRMRINSTGNIIKVLSGEDSIEREVVLRGSTTLTPGCIVVPYVGTIPSTDEAFDGSTGSMEAPVSAIGNLPKAVLQPTSANGRILDGEYHEGEQVPVWFPLPGSHARVRVDGSAGITKGELLTVATNGTGFVITGTTANAIGVAAEDTPSGDPSLPTYIVMEVF